MSTRCSPQRIRTPRVLLLRALVPKQMICGRGDFMCFPSADFVPFFISPREARRPSSCFHSHSGTCSAESLVPEHFHPLPLPPFATGGPGLQKQAEGRSCGKNSELQLQLPLPAFRAAISGPHHNLAGNQGLPGKECQRKEEMNNASPCNPARNLVNVSKLSGPWKQRVVPGFLHAFKSKALQQRMPVKGGESLQDDVAGKHLMSICLTSPCCCVAHHWGTRRPRNGCSGASARRPGQAGKVGEAAGCSSAASGKA